MMLNILDQVLNNTGGYDRTTRTTGPVVVSENHDLGTINWVGGMTDPGEMIGCGMYQELRRQDGETDAAYAARLPGLLAQLPQAHREKIERAMKDAAMRRASLDTTGGRVAVMVAGEPAWHGLGVNVANAVTSKDAIVLAGLAWDVSKRAMSFRKKDDGYTESNDVYAIVRDDSEVQLGTVGGRYAIIQNADGFAFLDDLIGEFGAKFHTAGAIHGGEKVWMQCELPNHNFEVVRGDEVQTFALFTNPHDGSGKAWCFPTTNRVVCANTYRTASKERAKGLGIRHTGDVKAKVAEARGVLGLAVSEIDKFKEAAGVMVSTRCDPEPFFEGLLDAVLDVTAAEAEAGADVLARAVSKTQAQFEVEQKRIQREIDRRENILTEILSKYEGETNGIGGIRGSQWAAFNAVTEYTNHRKPGREMGSAETRRSRRFESVLNGEADEINQTAFQLLTAARA